METKEDRIIWMLKVIICLCSMIIGMIVGAAVGKLF